MQSCWNRLFLRQELKGPFNIVFIFVIRFDTIFPVAFTERFVTTVT